MKAITHYEVYVVKLGRWALHARLSVSEQNQALETARLLEAESERATQVIEESLEPEMERLTVRSIAAYGQAPLGTKGPSTETDIASRVVMVGLNAFGIGAIGTALMAIMLSSLRGSAAGNSFNMLLLFTFAALILTAGLALFKIYIPMEWILWRGKGQESQKRTIDILLHGNPRETAPKWQPPEDAVSDEPVAAEETQTPAVAPIFDDLPTPPPPQRLETNADQGEQTSFQITSTPQPDAQPVEQAWRGWSFNDRETGFFDRLQLAPIRITQPPRRLSNQASTEKPFHEIDGRAGVYGWVIPPFLGDLDCRIHAAVFCFNFWTGVIPPSPMLGRSLL